jgi:hypothetical protein
MLASPSGASKPQGARASCPPGAIRVRLRLRPQYRLESVFVVAVCGTQRPRPCVRSSGSSRVLARSSGSSRVAGAIYGHPVLPSEAPRATIEAQCGCSSIGRAPASQAGCYGFESRYPLSSVTVLPSPSRLGRLRLGKMPAGVPDDRTGDGAAGVGIFEKYVRRALTDLPADIHICVRTCRNLCRTGRKGVAPVLGMDAGCAGNPRESCRSRCWRRRLPPGP